MHLIPIQKTGGSTPLGQAIKTAFVFKQKPFFQYLKAIQTVRLAQSRFCNRKSCNSNTVYCIIESEYIARRYKMGRYSKEFAFYANPAPLFDNIGKYLSIEGYKFTLAGQEQVFKKGNGILCGPTYIKIFAVPGKIVLQAWMKYALLPGVYCGEIDLDSFMGWAVKGPLKQRVAQIEMMILQAGGTVQPPYAAQYIPPQQ